MSEVVELLRRETVVIERPGGGETAVVVQLATLEIVEVAKQGPAGPPGPIGPPGSPGVYAGAVDEVSPSPVLIFENGLI